MIDIVQKGHPVLRQKAREVAPDEITGSYIKNVIVRMQQALSEQDDGVAIAAPQIGEPLRIFIISGKVFLPSLS